MLSKAQRGDQVEGWNDCPINMLSANSKSGSRTRRKVQRVSHVINGAELKSENKKLSHSVVIMTEKSSQNPISSSKTIDLNSEYIENKILSVLKQTKLEEAEVENLKSNILNAYIKISPNDKLLFNSIFDKILQLSMDPNSENVDKLRNEVSIFKTVENDVSECCFLFLKIIDNLKI